jgi:DNA-binding CsgD family transcriptional regulator
MLIDMWYKGVKVKEIAKALGIPINKVSMYVRVLGLSPRGKSPANIKIKNEDLNLIKEMWLDGATLKEIAEYFGVSEYTVGDYLRAMGLKRREIRKYPKIEKDYLEKLCKEGLTDEEIANIFHTSRLHIYRLRQKYGINKRAIIVEKSREKFEKSIETIVEILNEKGYVTSKELLEKGIKLHVKVLRELENVVEGIRWFRLTRTSTSKYSVFSAQLAGVIIIYLKGHENAVLNFLLSNLVNKRIPLASIKTVLKDDGASQELIDLLDSFSSNLKLKLKQ